MTPRASKKDECYTYASQFADVILMVFNVTSKESFEKVETVYMPFARRNFPQIPVIIVANEVDLRYSGKLDWVVTPEMGHQFAETHAAAGYLECSSLHGHGVQLLLEKAVKLAKERREAEQAKKRKCVIM
ncbi:hypothetical protein L596_013731 [Steinernema carpocapsae]|uniref:Uncharacterized protein n=1 Tax=Steinernema carpocapsae TaxID=34508 RepID=A0A4V6XWG7_STECR|nr:hypothetical protein L596_013731 [Steinernema carpocapsae]